MPGTFGSRPQASLGCQPVLRCRRRRWVADLLRQPLICFGLHRPADLIGFGKATPSPAKGARGFRCGAKRCSDTRKSEERDTAKGVFAASKDRIDGFILAIVQAHDDLILACAGESHVVVTPSNRQQVTSDSLMHRIRLPAPRLVMCRTPRIRERR
jgi:hypothetical protein